MKSDVSFVGRHNDPARAKTLGLAIKTYLLCQENPAEAPTASDRLPQFQRELRSLLRRAHENARKTLS